jgi:hypothetical protein
MPNVSKWPTFDGLPRGLKGDEANVSLFARAYNVDRRPSSVVFHALRQEGAVMAIKRPTKSKSTATHEPVATAPLRHVDVRPPQQMIPGEIYVGWLCKNRSCGQVIAITTPDGKAVTAFDDQLTDRIPNFHNRRSTYRKPARRDRRHRLIPHPMFARRVLLSSDDLR